MVMYNTLMGWCAGLVLLLIANVLFRVDRPDVPEPLSATYRAALLVVGAPLTVLSLHMALTWPLNVNPPINIAFAEPCLVLGVLALVAASPVGEAALRRIHDHRGMMSPVLWVIGALALPLLAISIAILRFNLVGDAPDAEPITGQLKGWENITFALMYLAGAFGCALVPFRKFRLAGSTFAVVGFWWLLFASLNYYTHIGLLINMGTGTEYRW